MIFLFLSHDRHRFNSQAEFETVKVTAGILTSHQLNGIIWQREIFLRALSHVRKFTAAERKNSISNGIMEDSKTETLIPRERRK